MELKKPNKTKVKILGEEWTIIVENADEMYDECDGYCDSSVKEIHIEIQKNEKGCKADLLEVGKRTVRHEIIHAFLFESGLDSNSEDIEGWAKNEEMVDWIALQFYKIQKVFEKLKV